MTMPIFNENWEHLPLNPIHLQPQLTANSTENDSAYKRKFATLKSYFRTFGNKSEGSFCYQNDSAYYLQYLATFGTILSEFEAIFVNYINDSAYFTAFCNIWEQF